MTIQQFLRTVYPSALVLALSVATPLAAQEAGRERVKDRFPRYAVEDLGTLGGTYSAAFALNELGQVTGESTTAGELEIHENGLRYQTVVRSDSRIDLLFNNIRHLFFQPNDSELVTIIHVHFKNPIMVGKRKTKDVQFYREVTDAQVDETGNRKRKYRYGDDDEHEKEAIRARASILLVWTTALSRAGCSSWTWPMGRR